MELVSNNPATGNVVWRGRVSSTADVADAIADARAAQPAWWARPMDERRAILSRFAELAAERKQQLADLILAEAGRVRSDANAEAAAVAGKVKLTFAALDERRADERHDLGNGVVGRVTHKPIGVLAVLGPFNFPMHLANGHLVPALLAGNACVFKPSEHTPACGELLASLFHDAGVPKDVLRVVQGGRDTGEALVGGDVDGVLLTGSDRVAEAVYKRLRYDQLLAVEAGGNNPLVVHGPVDVDLAVKLTVESAYISAGQRCTCARRLIVTSDMPGDFIEKLIAAVREVKVDLPENDPLIGPLITPTAVDALLRAQTMIVDAGATTLVESRRVTVDTDAVAATRRVAGATDELRPIGSQLRETSSNSAFVSPGLVDVTGIDVPDAEVFGPFLQLTRVATFADAIAAANATCFGLAAGLIGGTRGDFEQFLRESRAGCVNWNRPLTGASGKLPFGGVGKSGNFRPAGSTAIDYCTYPVATLESD